MSAKASTPAPFQVFLSGVIQGSFQDASHHDQDYRDRLRDLIREVHPEAEVICPVELNPNSSGYNDAAARATFFDELELAAGADVTVAFAPIATMGTAVEMYRAYAADRLVLTISPMAQNWAVRHLSTQLFPDLLAFEAFVRDGGIARALAAHHQAATS